MTTSQFDLPIKRTLQLYRGDSFAWAFDLTTPEGAPIDAGLPRMQVRDKPEGTLILDCTAYWTKPHAHSYNLLLPADVTAALNAGPSGSQWVWDLKLDDIENGFGTRTWFYGPFTVKSRVTQP